MKDNGKDRCSLITLCANTQELKENEKVRMSVKSKEEKREGRFFFLKVVYIVCMTDR